MPLTIPKMGRPVSSTTTSRPYTTSPFGQKNTNIENIKFGTSAQTSFKLDLENLFANERKFIIGYDPGVLPVIARKVKSRVPIVVSLAGESASGKSTAMNLFKNSFEKNNMPFSVIAGDDYFYDISEKVKKAGDLNNLFKSGFSFDDPKSLDLALCRKNITELKSGKPVKTPAYDFITHSSKPEAVRKAPSKFILHEGIFALTDLFNDVSDVKIYCETPKEIIDNRWWIRAAERGGSTKEQKLLFRLVEKGAKEFVRPSKTNANILIAGDCSKEEIAVFFDRLVGLFAWYCKR